MQTPLGLPCKNWIQQEYAVALWLVRASAQAKVTAELHQVFVKSCRKPKGVSGSVEPFYYPGADISKGMGMLLRSFLLSLPCSSFFDRLEGDRCFLRDLSAQPGDAS